MVRFFEGKKGKYHKFVQKNRKRKCGADERVRAKRARIPVTNIVHLRAGVVGKPDKWTEGGGRALGQEGTTWFPRHFIQENGERGPGTVVS